MKRLVVAFLLLAFALLLVSSKVDISEFLHENTTGTIRKSILRVARIAIPLKDRFLYRTIADKLSRIKSTGACRFCDLSNAELPNLELAETDLRHANLSNVVLSNANLSGSRISKANLAGADLSGANLSEVRL